MKEIQGTRLSDFLTKRENRKIDKILDKAAARMKKENGGTANAFVFLKCPLQCKSCDDGSEVYPECWEEMSKLMKALWEHCNSMGCCHYVIYDPDGNEVYDDDLPF